MPNELREINDKERRFCAEYVLDENGKRAATVAGWSAHSAAVTANRLLKKAYIKAEIANLRQKTANKLEITRERIMLEYARLAFADPRKLYDEHGRMKDLHELDDDTAAAVSEIQVDEIQSAGGEATVMKRKAKLWNKLGALDSVAKITGLMKEGTQVQVGIGLAIEISI